MGSTHRPAAETAPQAGGKATNAHHEHLGVRFCPIGPWLRAGTSQMPGCLSVQLPVHQLRLHMAGAAGHVHSSKHHCALTCGDTQHCSTGCSCPMYPAGLRCTAQPIHVCPCLLLLCCTATPVKTRQVCSMLCIRQLCPYLLLHAA